MRWIGRKLLASCMTLICGVLLAGAARARSINAADGHNDGERISMSGRNEFRVTLFGPSRIVDELYHGRGPKIDVLEAFDFGDDDSDRDHTTFDPRETFGVIDGDRFDDAGHGDNAHGESSSDDCPPVVPEPGTLGLLGGGLVALALAGRRRRRRSSRTARLPTRAHSSRQSSR